MKAVYIPTKQILDSVDSNKIINNPDYWPVPTTPHPVYDSVSPLYWKFVDDELLEMSDIEKKAVNEPLLDEMKQAKKDQINAKTDQIIAAGFMHNDVHFNCEPHDQSNLQHYMIAIALGQDCSAKYFRADGSDYFFTDNNDVIAISQKGETVVGNAVYSGGQLKTLVNDISLDNLSMSEAVDALNAIVDSREIPVF